MYIILPLDIPMNYTLSQNKRWKCPPPPQKKKKILKD